MRVVNDTWVGYENNKKTNKRREMSTRSYICKKMEDGNIIGIYCHHDGYISNNGRILFENYNTPDKVDELLALGDLSCLGEKINPQCREHSIHNQEPGVCVAYGRDAECDDTKAKLIDLDNERLYPWIEYIYLYENDNWKVAKIKPDKEIRFRNVKCMLSKIQPLTEPMQTIDNINERPILEL